jgi:hypothetical protein
MIVLCLYFSFLESSVSRFFQSWQLAPPKRVAGPALMVESECLISTIVAPKFPQSNECIARQRFVGFQTFQSGLGLCDE